MLNNSAQDQKFLICESCLDLPVRPRKIEEGEIGIKEVKYECESCDYFVVGLGE